MGRKVNPLSFRLGITENHRSIWFSDFKEYPKFLKKDRQTRILLIQLLKSIEEFENKKLFDLYTINLERFLNNTKLLIELKCLKKLQNIEFFKKYFVKFSYILLEIKKINFNQKFYIRIIKPISYLINADFILNILISNIDKRLTFRRASYLALKEFKLLSLQIKKKYRFIKIFGIKIKISGRIGGANLASYFWSNKGTIATQTLKSNISYQFKTISTTYGIIGLKV